jgi:hypothetical protein
MAEPNKRPKRNSSGKNVGIATAQRPEATNCPMFDHKRVTKIFLLYVKAKDYEKCMTNKIYCFQGRLF